MADCIPGTCGCPAPKCPCTCGKTFGPVDLRRVWRVGTSADYFPFEDYDPNGALFGFDIDLVKIVAERLRFVVDFHDMDFDSLFPALGVRYIDVIAAAVSETPERRRFADFTDPYFESWMVLLSHEGDIDDREPLDLGQLNGKIVAAQSGTTQEEILIDIRDGDGITGSPFEKPLAPYMLVYSHASLPTIVNQMIVNDEIDDGKTVKGIIHAVIMIDKVADNYVRRSAEIPLEHTNEAFLEIVETCSFALPLGSSLVEIINGIIGDLRKEGELDRLIEKWFGGRSIEQTP